MMKHTPGPWKVVDGSVVDTTCTVVCTAGLALMNGYVPDEHVARFNDRLIAAAPELLEALERLVNTPGINYTVPSGSADPFYMARAAIKKARGL